ncbi:MAG: Kelch repeat-containing protein [Candidatus Krumholzibacteriia bacterium]
MKTRPALLKRTGATAFAALLLLSLPPRSARGGDAGSWQPLYGPSQNGGAVALDDTRHRILTWGGDGTDMVREMTLDGYPYPWRMLVTAGTPPAVRTGHALIYDRVQDRLIVFGGQDAGGQAFNDLWQLTLGAVPTWSQLSPGGDAPDPRHDFGASYDPGSGRLVVFGGLDGDGNVVPGDLFVLNLNSNPPWWWLPGQSGDIPSDRYGSPLAFDPARDRLLLLGGNDGQDDLGDEYELDLATFAWSAAPTAGSAPEPRHDHVCVYDQVSSQLLVWGGTAADDSVRALDTATRRWSALNWFIGPPQQGGGRALGVFDWQWNRLVVLAGQRGAEAWTFWKMSPTNFWYWTGPTACTFGGSMVLDRAHDRAIAYGGTDWPGNSARTDFWQFSFADPIGWNGVNTGGVSPPARTGQVAVWDDRHDRMLVLCGRDENLQPTNTAYALQDSADFMNWQALAPGGMPPSPRAYAAGIYDPVGDRVLLFGGLSGAGFLGGLYQLSLASSPTWSQLTPAGGPSGRAGASAIYDAPRRRMILFGGDDNNYLNDVWALNLPAATWTQLAPTGTPPPGRWKHTAVFDARRNRMLVFGGRVSSADSADTWELSLASPTPAWTHLAPGGYAPLYRSEAAAAYDSTGDRMVVYGGISLIGPSWAIGQQDLWGLQFGGIAVGVALPPADRAASASGPRLSGSPNPFNGRARFELVAPAGPAAAVASLALYDLRGRRVATLFTGTLAGGESRTVNWDGNDDDGRPVGSGTYVARAVVGGRMATSRIAIVK